MGEATITVSYETFEARCKINITTSYLPTGYEDNYGYVDLGLSVNWATFNIGAAKPEDYGNYYAWGETSTKSRYTWSNYSFRYYGSSDNDVDELLEGYWEELKIGTFHNHELQDDFIKIPMD